MNLVYTGLIFLFSFFTVFAQAPDTLWTKKYGGSGDERAFCVHQTFDGGYIIAGHTESFGAGLDDCWLIKTDAAGDSVWAKTFGETDYDYCYDVQQTADSGYLLIGESSSFFHNLWCGLIIKTDVNGDTVWTRTVGEGQFYFARSGLENPAGEIAFTGRTKASAAGQEDLWFAKLDTSQNFDWNITLGGNNNDVGASLQQTKDGGFIIAGVTESFGAGNKDGWLIRADSLGDTVWTRTYGGTNSDWVYDVKQTDDGGFIIAGATESFGHVNYYTDAWMIRTDSNGDTVWAKTLGGPIHDHFLTVQQTLDGGFIFVGHLGYDFNRGDVLLVKTDAGGDTLWTSTYGDNYWNYGRSVEQTDDGGYIIAGDYYDITTNSRDVWLIKTAPDPSGLEPPAGNPFPETVYLNQNYPNPFNPTTTISWQLAVRSDVSLAIYNISGQKVVELVNEIQPPGKYTIQFHSENLSSGIYFCRLQAADFVETRKMILLK